MLRVNYNINSTQNSSFGIQSKRLLVLWILEGQKLPKLNVDLLEAVLIMLKQWVWGMDALGNP